MGTARHMAPAWSPCLWVRPTSFKSTCVSDPVLKKGTKSLNFTGLNGTREGERKFLPFSARPLGQGFQGRLYLATSRPCTILYNPTKSVRCGYLHSKWAWRRGPNPPHANTQSGSKGIGRTIGVSGLLLVALINKHVSPLPQLRQKCASLSSKWKELTVGLAVCRRAHLLVVFSGNDRIPQPSNTPAT